jgi:DNA polymerase III alpha subunit
MRARNKHLFFIMTAPPWPNNSSLASLFKTCYNSAQMFTIIATDEQAMRLMTENNGQTFIDLKSYRLPNDLDRQVKITNLYPLIPRKTRNVNFDIYDYESLFRDERVKKMIRNGDTIGCFYIESPGMRSLLRRLNVDTFEMLTAASSIIRPGVAESGMMREFIARHKDPRRRKYLIPAMEDVLGETYGVMIYQEDVIKVAHHIAGLSLDEADVLRRAMSGKMRSREAMEQLTGKFFSSCRKRGLSDYVARELWRQIESFAGYAFCKAHSASFALLSFQVAFLKAYYPAQFMASVLANGGGYYSAAVYVQESRRLGLKLQLPSINSSEIDYEGEGDTVKIGLMAVKNLSRNAMETIIEERKSNGCYTSLADFLVRTRLAYEESAMLIKCGAMDCLKETRPTLMRLLGIYLKRRRLLDENYNDLFMNETFRLEDEVRTPVDYGIEEKCRLEYEAFDYMVSRHPLEFYGSYSSNPSIVSARDAARMHGRRVKMIGWYMASKRIKTSKGEIMKFLSLEDLTGTFEAVLFPKVYAEAAEKTLSMGPYIIEGVVDAEAGNNIVVSRLEVISGIDIKSELRKDSADDVYTPDDEGFREEDINYERLAKTINPEQLVRAYAG